MNRSEADQTPRSETESRILEFFEISSANCSGCGTIAPLLPDYGVRDEASWDRKMSEQMAWMRENKEAVLAALPNVRGWPETNRALREVLESS